MRNFAAFAKAFTGTEPTGAQRRMLELAQEGQPGTMRIAALLGGRPDANWRFIPTAPLISAAAAEDRRRQRRYDDRLLDASERMADQLWPDDVPDCVEQYLERREFALGDVDPANRSERRWRLGQRFATASIVRPRTEVTVTYRPDSIESSIGKAVTIRDGETGEVIFSGVVRESSFKIDGNVITTTITADAAPGTDGHGGTPV